MKHWLSDPDFTLYVGDVREVLPTLEAGSVDCVATSPPFYALRDYGVDGQIGLEASPDEWARELVGVFRECRRVLADHGTLWVECGDSYAANQGGTSKQVANTKGFTEGHVPNSWGGASVTPIKHPYKPKDLLGQPWLLAFALRADGWYLRQCIVWSKPNAMPESVRDRCTTAHSYVFLFSKRPRYWFDAAAIAEPAAWERWGDQTVPKYEGTDTASGWMQPRSKQDLTGSVARPAGRGDTYSGFNGRWNERVANGDGPHSKNARSVWTIPTRGYPGAHFATWPEALVERIVKAGCPEWVCATCGKPRERITEVSYGKSPVHGEGSTVRKRNEGTEVNGWGGEAMPRLAKNTETVGWSDCGHGNYRPGRILDPFMGSGTTALVARRHGRHAVGVELNEEYARMAAERLQQLSLLAEGAA